MLRELVIRDFKLLSDVTLAFPTGLTAITGETGAGKTQCLEALQAALGARSGDDVIARGAGKSVLTAVFDLRDRLDVVRDLSDEGWLDEGEGEVVLERTVERGGPSRGRLNGRRVPLSTLQSVGERLVDVLGQHARSDILNRPALEILDSMGDVSHLKRLDEVRALYASWQAARNALTREEEIINRVRERRDLAEFQFNELTKAELHEGEEESLTRELELLSGVRERMESAIQAAKLLAGDDDEDSRSARDILNEALRHMEQLSDADPSLEQDTVRLRDMLYLSEELAGTLSRYSEKIVDDPERREWIEQRLASLHQLKRKYKTGEHGLIELRDRLGEELEQVATAGDRLRSLAESRDKALEAFLDAAQTLSKSRRTLAKKISSELKKHLADLDLPGVTFQVPMKSAPDDESAYRSDGIDRAEILISTNAAQEPGPLKKVASGGELSRILIAMKIVLAKRDRVPVLIFDEAEAGIGGETAFRVGEKLKELGASHQLIIVSHLPQVASLADCHWLIEKKSNGKEVHAEAREVRSDERVEEIGRMLGARGDRKALEKLARSFLRQ
jgi:DNA repair protein RecN (Recombination protein N)